MKKNRAAILLLILLVLFSTVTSGCIYTENPEQTSADAEMTLPTSDTEGAHTIADPESESEDGEEISVPESSASPEVTEAPDVTSPSTSEGQTEEITEPSATEKPIVTAEEISGTIPGETTKAGIPTMPDETRIPEVTQRPPATSEPENTTSAEVTVEPETSTEPEATTVPEVTTEPETTTESEPPVTVGPEPADVIAQGGTIRADMTEIFKIESHYIGSTHCRVVQGGCTDGTYLYVMLNDGKSTSNASISTIRKYDLATGALVGTYENYRVCHGNDMTYVPDTNELMIVHNSPERWNVSILDADTMQLKEVKNITFEIYSLAYDPYEDCFWAGLSYGFEFVKLDRNFRQIGENYVGVNNGHVKQGMDVDSKYLYFAQYQANSIMVYDKQGNFVRMIALPKTSYEVENICHIGDDFYVVYYKSKAGGMVYKTELSKVADGEIDADLTQWTTVPTYTDADGNLFKVAQGSCSDGEYLYLSMNNDVSSDFRTVIYKISLATGKIVLTREGYRTGRTNDMTYNPKMNRIIMTHNGSPSNRLTILDADTLEVVEEKTLDFNFFALTYDAVNDCYWAALSSTYNFAKLDLNFKKVATYTGYNTGFTKQAMECDGEYLYFIQSAVNAVAVYKTDGTFVGYATLPMQREGSAQSVCLIGNTFYLGYNDSAAGGILYIAEIAIKE